MEKTESYLDEQESLRGEEICKLLGLKKKRDGYYHTTWGRKTSQGVYKSVLRIALSDVLEKA